MSSSGSSSTSPTAPATTPNAEVENGEPKKDKITYFFKKSGRTIGPTQKQSQKIAESYEKQPFRHYSAPRRAKKWQINKKTEQFLTKFFCEDKETATSSSGIGVNVRTIRSQQQEKLPRTPLKAPVSPNRVEKSVPSSRCEYCGELFRSQSAETRHRNEKHEAVGIRYRCRISGCGRTFGRKDRLYQHEGTHSAPITCPLDLCGATFANDSNARRHEKQVHGPAWACTLDGCLKAVSGQRMTQAGILKHMDGHEKKGHYAHLSHRPEPLVLPPITPEDVEILNEALTGLKESENTDDGIQVDESPENGRRTGNAVPGSGDDDDREGGESEPLDNPEQVGEAIYQEMLMLIEHQVKDPLPEAEILHRNQLFMAVDSRKSLRINTKNYGLKCFGFFSHSPSDWMIPEGSECPHNAIINEKTAHILEMKDYKKGRQWVFFSPRCFSCEKRVALIRIFKNMDILRKNLSEQGATCQSARCKQGCWWLTKYCRKHVGPSLGKAMKRKIPIIPGPQARKLLISSLDKRWESTPELQLLLERGQWENVICVDTEFYCKTRDLVQIACVDFSTKTILLEEDTIHDCKSFEAYAASTGAKGLGFNIAKWKCPCKRLQNQSSALHNAEGIQPEQLAEKLQQMGAWNGKTMLSWALRDIDGDVVTQFLQRGEASQPAIKTVAVIPAFRKNVPKALSLALAAFYPVVFPNSDLVGQNHTALPDTLMLQQLVEFFLPSWMDGEEGVKGRLAMQEYLRSLG